MATPVGHSLVGYAISGFFTAPRDYRRYQLILLSILMANAPDLDFLPGLFMGRPALYHQGISHSLGAALIVSTGTATFYYLRGCSFSAIFGICFVSYFSHLAIDFFGPDGRLPYGIPLLWPINDEHFISSIPVFLGMHHAGSSYASLSEWLKGLLDLYNFRAITLEIIFLAPFIFLTQKKFRK